MVAVGPPVDLHEERRRTPPVGRGDDPPVERPAVRAVEQPMLYVG